MIIIKYNDNINVILMCNINNVLMCINEMCVLMIILLKWNNINVIIMKEINNNININIICNVKVMK